MTLDPDTVKLITALVVHVAGGIFVLETMLRKDDRAGRVWALGFIAGMIATEACRLAANGPEFIARVRDELTARGQFV